MRLTGIIIALCIGLAVLKVAAGVLALALIGGLLIAGISRPAETLSFIAGCMLLSLVGSHPWAAAVILATLAVLASCGKGPESA